LDTSSTARSFIYTHVMQHGVAPSSVQVAEALGCNVPEAQDTLRRLGEAHVLVLQPDGEVLMANPFSAVPTPFKVQAGERGYFGNCIWDALGILAMLGQDGVVHTSCGCCSQAMTINVTAGGAVSQPGGLAHFAIPAARWWDDIVFN
jgi:hypothetical protein